MDHFAGLDVSINETSVCIVDDAGRVIREFKAASEPDFSCLRMTLLFTPRQQSEEQVQRRPPIVSDRSMFFRNANAYSAPAFRNATNCDITSAPSRGNYPYPFISWPALPTVKKGMRILTLVAFCSPKRRDSKPAAPRTKGDGPLLRNN
jgi:hypothetical protein